MKENKSYPNSMCWRILQRKTVYKFLSHNKIVKDNSILQESETGDDVAGKSVSENIQQKMCQRTLMNQKRPRLESL